MSQLLAVGKSETDKGLIEFSSGRPVRGTEDLFYLKGMMCVLTRMYKGTKVPEAVELAGVEDDEEHAVTEIKIFGKDGVVPSESYIHQIWRKPYRRFFYSVRLESINYACIRLVESGFGYNYDKETKIYRCATIISERELKDCSQAV